MESYRITVEAPHILFVSNREVLLYDVRQPLDLLADSEIIPGATRIPPKELLQNPQLIPKDRDLVVYCTCPGDKTSRKVLYTAEAMHFFRVKFLERNICINMQTGAFTGLDRDVANSDHPYGFEVSLGCRKRKFASLQRFPPRN